MTPRHAYEITTKPGCRTAKVKAADHPESLTEELARVEAVRDALGRHGSIRVGADGGWDVDTAVRHICELDRAAGGLEYVEQPCRSIEDLAQVHPRVEVRIAADESISCAEDPLRVAVAGAADVAVIKCTPLGVSSAHAGRRGDRTTLRGLLCIGDQHRPRRSACPRGALPELDFACGLGTLSLLRGDVVADGDSLRPAMGYLPVPRSPAAPDPALVETYHPAAPQRATWRRERLARCGWLRPVSGDASCSIATHGTAGAEGGVVQQLLEDSPAPLP